MYDGKTRKLVQTLSAENVKSRGIICSQSLFCSGTVTNRCSTFFRMSGMCMCVRAWCDGSTGIPLVLAGFDDGSLLLWDVRRPSAEMTSLKLFPEPGEISTTS